MVNSLIDTVAGFGLAVHRLRRGIGDLFRCLSSFSDSITKMLNTVRRYSGSCLECPFGGSTPTSLLDSLFRNFNRRHLSGETSRSHGLARIVGSAALVPKGRQHPDA